jgi:hypothetical protein
VNGNDGDRFLTVLGFVTPDGGLELFPGFETAAPHRVVSDPTSNFVVELLDLENRTLIRHALPAEELCGDGPSTGGTALMGKIPFPGSAATMRILRDEQVLLERSVPAGQPDVRLTWEPSDRLQQHEIVTWEATHPQGLRLHFIVVYDHEGGDRWRPVSLVTSATSYEVNLGQLPGGRRCRLGVIGTDGFNTTWTTSREFTLPLRPCQAFIFSPIDGERLRVGEPLVLRGQGYWMEEDRTELEDLEWFSSLDGALGRGSAVGASLRLGEHTITLLAGRDDRASTMSVTVNVQDDGGTAATS